MQLIADRFAVIDADRPIDLATGNRVHLTIQSAGGDTEQKRWALECDGRQRFHHPAVPSLVDYGAIGESQRFEACEPAHCTDAVDAPALMVVERPGLLTLGELFERADPIRANVAALWGPAGAGKGTMVLALARIARLHGFVPVAAPLLPAVIEPLAGRSLLVIVDGDAHGWSALLYALATSCRPHVLITTGSEDPRGVDGVGLTPLSADVLVDAVRPRRFAERHGPALRRLATRVQGWPGRFARVLWPQADAGSSARTQQHRQPHGQLKGAAGAMEQLAQYSVRPTSNRINLKGLKLTAVRAAEESVAYAVEETAAGAPPQGQWIPLADVRTLQHRMAAGERLMAEGRHGPGERLLRQAIGALARRQEWRQAGEGALALASGLLDRGRAREAQTVLKAATEYFHRIGDERRLLDVAGLDGHAAIDLARPDEAETRLSAAVAAARAIGDRSRLSAALAALARADFWRARYESADQTLAAADDPPADERARASILGLRAAAAVGTGHFQRAVTSVMEAFSLAESSRESRLIAAAASRAAFVHLALGDIAAVERYAGVSIAAARSARVPLVAARARLLLAEAMRRGGRSAAAIRLIDRITRLRSSALPPIVRARCDLLRDLVSRSGPIEPIVARHVTESGLGALALLVPARRALSAHGSPLLVDDLVGILDLCQTSDDERAVLSEVCRRVRSRLHGAAAGVTVAERSTNVVLVSDGGRIETVIAERSMTGGLTIAPHRCADRLEAAAPIRYGGAAIGAIVVRWTIGTLHDLSPAESLLTTIAAVIAPIVAATIARRQQGASLATTGLLGSSSAMIEVRRAVEHAAPAPFPVLVEGESGSGKEVVARSIHRASPRRDRPFCTVNCAALPDDLIEAELFGHSRGAFTGAVADRPGVFEEAHGGTLMLDEVGELSPRAQAKVLRVIQESELRRVGENVSRRVDVRIVSATNRNLRNDVAAGRFRLDLLYRLDVLRIDVPPLRERREDIPELAEHFWRDVTQRVGSRATLAAATVAALARYDWPGNVRELQNVLAALVVRSGKRGVVPPAALGPHFADRHLVEASRLDAARRTFEERFVRAALVRTGGHRSRAAEELGVTRQGLAKVMSRLGISQ